MQMILFMVRMIRCLGNKLGHEESTLMNNVIERYMPSCDSSKNGNADMIMTKCVRFIGAGNMLYEFKGGRTKK